MRSSTPHLPDWSITDAQLRDLEARRPLDDLLVVPTGEFRQISRAQFRTIVAAAGGHVMGRVTEATDMLVVGGPGHVSTRKLAVARREQARAVSETEFVELLGLRKK